MPSAVDADIDDDLTSMMIDEAKSLVCAFDNHSCSQKLFTIFTAVVFVEITSIADNVVAIV